MPHLDWWENQKFLGRESTFGDDRSLTNCVLREWKVKYEARAVSHTIVPTTFKQFMRQQLRWKRSWTRESLIVARFIWSKNPIASACRLHRDHAAHHRAGRGAATRYHDARRRRGSPRCST